MSYGKLRRLLSKEYQTLNYLVLIESDFMETTRKGKRINPVRLALTPDTLIVASETTTYVSKPSRNLITTSYKEIELRHLYPLELVQMTVFKRSQRLVLKICIASKITKYFELGLIDNREVFWKLWCSHAATICANSKKSPRTVKFNQQHNSSIYKKRILKWRNKWLYLGSKREFEDKNRPIPVPGLGPTEDIKLLYLKQQHFGCWEQSEHWVQCENSGSNILK